MEFVPAMALGMLAILGAAGLTAYILDRRNK
jgi:hypothetical protein